MSKRKSRHRAAPDYRRLIHLLNRRYHDEFVRAERLRADLEVVEALRATWLFALLKRFERGCARPPARPPAARRSPPGIGARRAAGPRRLIIPFRDRPELLRDCLASLRPGTYHNFEVVLVDNGSDAGLLRLLERLRRRQRYHVVCCPEPFNFSRLCNAGAEQARGDYLLFLNNDTCVLSPDWLERMLCVACQPGVGAVAATLLIPTGRCSTPACFVAAMAPGTTSTAARLATIPASAASCVRCGRCRPSAPPVC